MLEGLSAHMDLTFLGPGALGDRLTNSWPPRPGARVERVVLPGPRLVFALRTVVWLVRHRKRFDVAFVLDNLVAALAANIAHRLGGPPVILQLGRPTLDYVRCQRGLRPRAFQAVRELGARLLVSTNDRLAHGVGAISGYVATDPARRNGNVRIVRWYGVDLEAFAPLWTRTEARRHLGLPTGTPIVMYRSRIAPEKDPDAFLRAISLLRAEGRDLVALYMGGEWEEFAARARELGVDVVARKPSSMDEIPMWYVAADVDVQTSRAEGLGISPLEALACGTPVVVSDCGGLPEVVDGGRCGALTPPGAHTAVARAIASFLDDPDRAAEVARVGREWVRDGFDASAAFTAWTDLAKTVARSRRWRVLFVDHETRLSGGQRDLTDLVGALDPERIEVHAALSGDGELADALRAHGAVVHIVDVAPSLRRASRFRLARRPDLALRHAAAASAAAWRVARLARRLRPDVVHSNSLKAHLLASPAAVVARAKNVWHVRDILDGWLSDAWRVLAGVLADRVVCLSEVAAEPFRRGRVASKVRVVYNGIRLRPVEAREVERWRTDLGATDGEPVIGIVGQLAHWKGQDTFIEAAALVAQVLPDARFAVVGECLFPDNEREYAASLRSTAGRLGLDGRLRFVGHAEPIEPVMAALDVCVHASRLPEPFGRVIVEAMAQGTPVVASALGAGPELVPDGAGRLVRPDDPDELARAITDVIDGRACTAPAAREAAKAFDIGRTAAGVLAVYEELLSE